jgi:hypothetical protein
MSSLVYHLWAGWFQKSSQKHKETGSSVSREADKGRSTGVPLPATEVIFFSSSLHTDSGADLPPTQWLTFVFPQRSKQSEFKTNKSKLLH